MTQAEVFHRIGWFIGYSQDPSLIPNGYYKNFMGRVFLKYLEETFPGLDITEIKFEDLFTPQQKCVLTYEVEEEERMESNFLLSRGMRKLVHPECFLTKQLLIFNNNFAKLAW